MANHKVTINRVLQTDPLQQHNIQAKEKTFSNLVHNLIPISQPQDISEQSPSFQSKEISLLQQPQTQRQQYLNSNDFEEVIQVLDIQQNQYEYVNHQEQNNKFNHIFEEFSSQASIDKQPILAPLQMCSLIWNLIFLSNNISLAILIPLNQSFYMLIFICFKLIDVMIVINSPFYQDGELIQQFNLICVNYLTELFKRDFVHIVSLSIIVIFNLDQIYIKWICIIFIIVSSWKRTIQILTYLQIHLFYQLKQRLIISKDIINILNTLSKLIIIIHVLTCVWVEVESDEHMSIYTQALFHVVSFLSMNSTYIPQNEDQTILCIIMGIISVIFQAFIYCSIKELDIFKNSSTTVSLTQFDDLPAQLFLRAASFKQQQIHEINRNNNFMQQLPEHFKREITLSRGYKYISNYFQNYEENSLKSITLICETLTIPPNSSIIQFQQLDDCSLYFIIKGKVNVVSNNNILLGSFHEGETFGELSFIAQLPRTANVVSSSQCQLLKLSRTNFLTCLTSTDQQLFCKTQNDLLFNQIYPSACFCCGLNNHVIINCPQLTYQPSKIDIINNHSKMQNQDRSKYIRLNCNRRIVTWELIKQFQLDRSEFIDLYCENTAQMPEITLSSNLPYENTYSQQAIAQKQVPEEEFSSDFNEGYTSNSNEDPEFRRLPDPYSSSDIDPFIRKDANKNTINTAGFGKKYVDSQIQENIESCSILDCFKKSELDRKTTDQKKLNPSTAFPSNQYISDLIMKQLNSAQNLNSQDSLKLSSKGTFLQNRTQSQREKSTSQQQFQSQSNSKSKTSSCFVPFSGYDNVDRYSVYFSDFERMCNYDKFYPQYNYNQVIDEINKPKLVGSRR